MNQADILAEKVLDDILEETVLEMQRWVHKLIGVLGYLQNWIYLLLTAPIWISLEN